MNESMAPTFRKVDLHVHTAKSVCYGDSLATSEQIVNAALAENLEVAGLCSKCHPEVFYSYRGEKETGRFAATIGIKR